MNELHYDDFAFARPYLAAGETILWRGKPEKGHLLGPQDVFMIPFSIFWCGFAIFWFISALQVGFFAVFGIPFVCVGLYITVGRFIHLSWKRKNTGFFWRKNWMKRSGNFTGIGTWKNWRIFWKLYMRCLRPMAEEMHCSG